MNNSDEFTDNFDASDVGVRFATERFYARSTKELTDKIDFVSAIMQWNLEDSAGWNSAVTQYLDLLTHDPDVWNSSSLTDKHRRLIALFACIGMHTATHERLRLFRNHLDASEDDLPESEGFSLEGAKDYDDVCERFDALITKVLGRIEAFGTDAEEFLRNREDDDNDEA